MTNRYTQPMYEGKSLSLNEYLLSVAEGFVGQIVRDYHTFDYVVADKEGHYYDQRIANAEKELEKAQSMTLLEADDLMKRMHARYKEDRLSLEKLIQERRSRYESMLEQVEAWEVPSHEHLKLKDEAITAISHSMDFDCFLFPPMETKEMTPAEYLRSELKHAEEELAKALKEKEKYKQELKRNQLFLDRLVESLPKEVTGHG